MRCHVPVQGLPHIVCRMHTDRASCCIPLSFSVGRGYGTPSEVNLLGLDICILI